MLPLDYELPAAIALICGGVLSCFAGYRLFRVVLGIYGFILGAMMASAVIGANSTVAIVVAALVGGLFGAVVLVFTYIVGVALAGAGVAVAITHFLWPQFATGDPSARVLVAVSIAGAVGALLVQRYVIVVATAFAGAWTVVIGAVNVLAVRGLARGVPAADVWILYPTSLGDQRWVQIAWIMLGLVGSAVQLSMTGRKR